MTKEEILAKLDEFKAIATGPEKRSLTDDEYATVADLEAQLKRANDTEAFLGRHQGYVTPANHIGVHVAPAKDGNDEYRSAFASYLLTGKANADLVENRAQTAGTDSAGGYLVPDQLLSQIETRLKAFAGVENEAFVEQVDNGRTVKLPTSDDTANVAVPVAEATAPSSGGADLTVGEIEVEHHTFTTSGAGQAPIAVSFQLLQDGVIDVESWIVDRIVERFGRGLAQKFVTGTGAGEPFGITSNATLGSTFTAATIDKDELISALHDVDPAYRHDAVWIFNDATLEQIRKLEDSTGRPLWTPQASAGLEGSIGGTLMGHRVVIDQGFDTYTDATTNKFGVFGSVKTGYWIRKVRGIRLIVDELSGAQSGMVRYTAHMRVGGVVRQPRAYTVLKNAA